MRIPGSLLWPWQPRQALRAYLALTLQGEESGPWKLREALPQAVGRWVPNSQFSPHSMIQMHLLVESVILAEGNGALSGCSHQARRTQVRCLAQQHTVGLCQQWVVGGGHESPGFWVQAQGGLFLSQGSSQCPVKTGWPQLRYPIARGR